MRFDNDGLALWFGSPHASAPPAVVPAGSRVGLTVGTKPARAGNVVEVRYRVDGGAEEALTASPMALSNDSEEQ